MEDCPPKSHWTKHRNLGCLTTARRKMNYNMNKVRIVKDLPCFLGSFSFLNKTKSAKRFWNHRPLATNRRTKAFFNLYYYFFLASERHYALKKTQETNKCKRGFF